MYAFDNVSSCNVGKACILYNMTNESNWLLIVKKISTATATATAAAATAAAAAAATATATATTMAMN